MTLLTDCPSLGVDLLIFIRGGGYEDGLQVSFLPSVHELVCVVCHLLLDAYQFTGHCPQVVVRWPGGGCVASFGGGVHMNGLPSLVVRGVT